jgi:predicted porin
VPFVESINGYRYVEQMFIDRTKFGTTTDWGVHIFGNLFDHIVGYQVSVVDGEGFKQPSLGNVNRTDAVDVEGRVNATYKHFTVAVGGYDGKLGKDVENVNTYNTAQRFDALIAYTDSKLRLGGEYLWARYWADVTQASPAKTNVTDGYSAFGSYNFTPKLALFGRFDWLKPKANTAPSEHETFYDVGLSYKPIAPLDFALVYKHDSVVNGSLTTADGVIGIPTGATLGKGLYDEVGLFTQVKF